VSDHICGFICKNPECERNNKIDDTFQFPAELEDSYLCVDCGWKNELDNEITQGPTRTAQPEAEVLSRLIEKQFRSHAVVNARGRLG